VTEERGRGIITPRTLRGFNDLLPEEAILRSILLRRIEDTFFSFGFQPIATPALEYVEILKGKGGEESDAGLFEFQDQGGRQVALRYDLTVPLARYVAEHEGSLTFPFKAASIGLVWRGDRPQRGRYRELIQCDADVIGAVGPVVDAEILQLMHTTLGRLCAGEVLIRVNDRRLLDAFFERLGLLDRRLETLRAIDKLEKIGSAGVEAELRQSGAEDKQVAAILELLSIAELPGTAARFEAVGELVQGYGRGDEALEGLREVFDLLDAGGVPASDVTFDPSIARGLDYYTGMVYETTLRAAPEIGSVSSGGRYDDLAGLYTTTRLPGVGGSIGISRLVGALGAGRIGGALTELPPFVLVTYPRSESLRALAVRIATAVRRELGARVELYPIPRPHKKQMRYADSRHAAVVLTVDEDHTVRVKDMTSGEAVSTAPDDIVAAVRTYLQDSSG
jgi:histidyl-tRNA synthetase